MPCDVMRCAGRTTHRGVGLQTRLAWPLAWPARACPADCCRLFPIDPPLPPYRRLSRSLYTNVSVARRSVSLAPSSLSSLLSFLILFCNFFLSCSRAQPCVALICISRREGRGGGGGGSTPQRRVLLCVCVQRRSLMRRGREPPYDLLPWPSVMTTPHGRHS